MDNRYSIPQSGEATKTVVNAGLRSYMNNIYNRMVMGVLTTGVVAYLVAGNPPLMKFFLGGPQLYAVIFAPLLIVWFGFNPARMNSRMLALSFFALSVLYGISFSVIGVMFTHESIARAFFVATAMFAGLSIFGYTTKKDLTALGTFAVMGVWGIFIASILNMFFQSSGMQLVISGVGIIAFSGITAWYTQSMKQMYNPAMSAEMTSRLAWTSALQLYISFIALFQYLIQFMGQRN